MTDDTPERIWAAIGTYTGQTMWWPDKNGGGTEYIRADIASVMAATEVAARDTMIAEAVAAERERCIGVMIDAIPSWPGPESGTLIDFLAAAIREGKE